MAYNASQHLNGGLARFGAAREGARRFHKAAIGDVDPSCCFADWLLRVARNDVAGIDKVYGHWLPDGVRSGPNSDLGYVAKTMMSTGASGQTGGYLVPQQLYDELLVDIAEEAIVRPRATVVTMKSATMLLPLPDSTTVPGAAGTSPFYGGMQMSWTQEAIKRAETEPKFKLTELHAWELSGFLYLSNPLAQDATGLDTWLRRLIARSIAHYEDQAFLVGTSGGAGMPTGIVAAPAALTVARATSVKIQFADIAGMMAALLPFSFTGAIWAFHPSTLPQTMQMLDTTNRATTMVTGADGEVKEGARQWQITGFAAYCSEWLTALASTTSTPGDIILFDPRLYVIGDRRATEISVSMDEPTAFLANQQAWKVVHRVDGQPWIGNVVTLQNTSTTVSPYVLLGAK